jgi:hypothetical protein
MYSEFPPAGIGIVERHCGPLITASPKIAVEICQFVNAEKMFGRKGESL